MKTREQLEEELARLGATVTIQVKQIERLLEARDIEIVRRKKAEAACADALERVKSDLDGCSPGYIRERIDEALAAVKQA